MRDVPIKEHVRIVLQKMFEGTGIEYSDEYVKQEYWFCNYQWTDKQHSDYVEWLTDYLYKNKEARKQIMTTPTKIKSLCRLCAEGFAAMFGWTFTEINFNEETTNQTN